MGVKGGPLSFRAERELGSTSLESVSEGGSLNALDWVKGAVGTRQVMGTSECT